MKVWFDTLKHKRDVRRFRVELSALKLSKDFLALCGRIMAAGIIDNIKKQQQWGGGALKKNAESTRKRKQRKGRPLLSLVDEMRRFVRGRGVSWAIDVDPAANDVVVTPATEELRQLVEWVQEMDYVGWFGISRSTYRALKEAYHAEIKRAIDEAAKRLNRRSQL